MPDLCLEELSVSFGARTVLDGLSLQLHAGEIGCLLGASGCGKTTALRTIAGFEKPQQGQISLGGRVLQNAHTHVPAHLRRIGMVFQDYALFPHLNIAQNIAFGLRNNRRQRARTEEMLKLIGLGGYEKYYPHQLSGGQQQRVAIARALAPQPDLILLDEPFSNLDSELRHSLAKEVRTLLKAQGASALLVTHDKQEAFAIADKIGILAQGRLQQWAMPDALYRQPATAYVAEFIGEGVLLDAVVRQNTQRTEADLGFTQITLPDHAYPDNSTIRLLIRPDDICINPAAATAVRVQESDFLGHQYRHRVITANGQTLIFRTDNALAQNQTVQIELKPRTVIAFPQTL